MNLPRIGIIGGAGPMAGALLFQKIIQICQRQYRCQQDEDFPCIFLLSYPFMDMLNNPTAQQTGQIKGQLKACITRLIQNEVDQIVIACNTLHAFLDQMEKQDDRLTHMIKETGNVLKQRQIYDRLILCSTTSSCYQLHRRYFECTYPDERNQTCIQALIDKILAGQQIKEDAEQLAMQLNQVFKEQEAANPGIILGCTELSVLNEQFPLHENGLDKRLRIFDPNQIVAERICQQIFK